MRSRRLTPRWTRFRVSFKSCLYVSAGVTLLLSVSMLSVLNQRLIDNKPPVTEVINKLDQMLSKSSFPKLGPRLSPLNISVPLLQPLQEIDREKYTIRINTWRRPENLLKNVAYLSTCEGVAEIQIVWCDNETDPPIELMRDFTNVKVDRRPINSLNERFNLSSIGSTTLGVIHLDDDDLFPCIALDNVFFKWTYNPERLVSLSPRYHDATLNAYYSWFRSSSARLEAVPKGRYTMAMPTIGGVVHRDYLDWYTQYFPREMYMEIAKQFNCEDIALNFFITALTKGQPPLLGDFWAQQSVSHGEAYFMHYTISSAGSHFKLRSNCTGQLLKELGLNLVPHDNMWTSMVPTEKKEEFKHWMRKRVQDVNTSQIFPLNFEVGATGKGPINNATIVPRHARVLQVIEKWKASPNIFHYYNSPFQVVKGKRKKLPRPRLYDLIY